MSTPSHLSSSPPQPTREPSRGKILLAASAIVAAALAAYANSFSTPFVFDDQLAIVENPTIRHLENLGEVLWPRSFGAGAAGRPFVNLTLALNYAAGGLNPWGYHAVNVLLHALAGLTLFGLIRRTLEKIGSATNAFPVALASAVIWTVHPLLTESVTCVIQRNEVLASLCYLLTLYCFVRGTSTAPGKFWLPLAALACLLGMTAKEIVVSAPLMVFLYDRTFVAGTFAAAWRQRRGFYASLIGTWVALAALMLASQQRGGTVGFGLGVSAWDYLLTQCQAIGIYVKLALWPHPLVVDYGTSVATSLADVLPQALALVALLVGTIASLRQRSALGFLGACFFMILAPSSSFVPLVTQPIAEHRMYLPLAAIVVLAVLGGYRWLGSKSVFVFGAVAVGLAVMTSQRNSDYRSNEALWRDTVAKRPQNARAQCSLADALFGADRVDEALPHYTEAIRLKPDYAEAQLNFGSALLARGQAAEALPKLEAALRLQPMRAKTHHNLANALIRLGRAPEAFAHYAEAARLSPDTIATLSDWGNALVRTGDTAGAITRYEEAIRRDPKFAMGHSNLANVLTQNGRFTEAIAHYETALRLEPNYAEGHNNLAGALAQSGRFSEAIQHFETALRLRPDYPSAHENLGRVYLALGDNAAAQREFALARRSAPAR